MSQWDDDPGSYGTPPPGYTYDDQGNLQPVGADPAANPWSQGYENSPTTPPLNSALPDVNPTLTPDPTPAATPTSSGVAGGSSLGPWSGTFSAPTPTALPTVPTFTPPTYTPPPAFSYADFTGPTMADALNDPGYQFRLNQGNQQLQSWAAARGTLNDSSTGKALTDYGQASGSQEYQNVWNRDETAWGANRQNALDTYNTNYKTQYTDPYTYAYQSAKDQFAPLMTQYSTQAANTQFNNNMANNNAWNNYYLGFTDYENRRNQAVQVGLQS